LIGFDKEMSEKIVKGVYMDSSMWDAIEEESKKEERSTNWMISKILKDWIESRKSKTRRARARKK
jgi:hypothetical protein